jgi:hypothetical protein
MKGEHRLHYQGYCVNTNVTRDEILEINEQ